MRNRLILIGVSFMLLYPLKLISSPSQLEAFIDDENANKKKVLIRSTTGLSGASEMISTKSGVYSICYSVGQSSIIGGKSKKGFVLRNGFQQPLLSAQIVPIPTENELKAIVYPNPFRHSISININEPIIGEILLSVTDINGRVVMLQKIYDSQQINLPMNEVLSGTYILKMIYESKSYTATLIKR
ncbi:T9SS type A sorting domain-containing protein [Marinifilum fragile]|uniref:T9SS type A sorting domain-containing protein n=1 Tax=Marinifilum fragile TaxID=570161 RepID=UPI002AA8060A|nr:T9SS type A sorting domain-containing protein [Marinifilum fragile]